MSNITPYQNKDYNGKSDWKIISQGAEARIWFIPSFVSSTNVRASNSDDNKEAMNITSLPAICKERFSKKYRHETLDSNILKSRTKSEVKCLVRCRRGGVPCPAVLACDMGPKNLSSSDDRRLSMCLFLEFVPGMTVRECLEKISSSAFVGNEKESPDKRECTQERSPPQKKLKNNEEVTDTRKGNNLKDGALKKIGNAIGTIVAKMHNVNIVHGDLTTSNIMLKNPHSPLALFWEPDLVLIDFGLSGTAGAKGVNHEENAVDLYVLERALDSTHPSCSIFLQKEIFRAYKRHCHSSDSVLQRLSQVRLRGRKRECFG